MHVEFSERVYATIMYFLIISNGTNRVLVWICLHGRHSVWSMHRGLCICTTGVAFQAIIVQVFLIRVWATSTRWHECSKVRACPLRMNEICNTCSGAWVAIVPLGMRKWGKMPMQYLACAWAVLGSAMSASVFLNHKGAVKHILNVIVGTMSEIWPQGKNCPVLSIEPHTCAGVRLLATLHRWIVGVGCQISS